VNVLSSEAIEAAVIEDIRAQTTRAGGEPARRDASQPSNCKQ